MYYYAQNREDVLLDRVFRDVEHGFYVDVGANHPTHWSVTRHFYDHGWRGINIEPGLIFDTLARQRPRDINLQVAVSDVSGRLTFYEYPGAHGVSGFSSELPPLDGSLLEGRLERQVETLTLRQIFDQEQPPTIDFLSIDVEGHERQVLMSNDWSRWRPRVVLVEATLPCQPVPCHEKWEDVILGAGYLFAQFDGLNRYYVRPEDRPLLERFATPVCVFDDCLSHEIPLLEREIDHLRGEAAAARARADHLLEVRAMHERHIAELTAELTHLTRGTGRRTLEAGLWVARQLQRLAGAARTVRNALPSGAKSKAA
jgi:FkbM family methyltransferase